MAVMLIMVYPGRQRSEVREAEDLKRFSVVVVGEATDRELERALAPLARLASSTHAWVSIDRLRVASGRGEDHAWCQAFDAVVEYATSKGWVDETGSAIRAHLVHEEAVDLSAAVEASP
jgi:hypothetical protein